LLLSGLGVFVLGYLIRSIDARSTLGRNDKCAMKPKSERTHFRQPRPTEAFCEWNGYASSRLPGERPGPFRLRSCHGTERAEWSVPK